MPPSQLKQLKASLREHGVLGPQKSKKQRKENAKDAQKRLQRSTALDNIRERFNPFETKTSARPQKYAVISNKDVKTPVGRPGVTRGLGEERRKETLLRELQSRNKVGGMLDKRFGENDPTLTPEQKAAERFARQSERRIRKTSMFNLEDDAEEEMALTHGGRALDFEAATKDDYDQADVDGSFQDFEDQHDRSRKRIRPDDEEREDDDDAPDKLDLPPERKKSKKEVMEEVIAKSKLHRAERQAAKEADDDLRLELDQGMSNLFQAFQAHKVPQKPLPPPPSDAEHHMDPSRAAMLAGKSREEVEKEYEANLRQMRLDARSKPSVRTKTDEEKAVEEAQRLQDLETKRVRRMKGEAESSDDEKDADADDHLLDEQDDAEAFGLNQPETFSSRPQLDVEDEDEFVLDNDLIASGSEVDTTSDESDTDDDEQQVDEDDDFINGLTLPAAKAVSKSPAATNGILPYTYACPQTHKEFLQLLKDKDENELPTLVQRIRALHHKGLADDNQQKLGRFAHILIEHVAYLADEVSEPNFEIIESILRHVHSMAKSQPEEVSSAFRSHLEKISSLRPLNLSSGDLMILTGISTTFPTSDHFHPVATPAMLTIARYLGQSQIQSLQVLGKGAYCCTLALQHQSLARRYVPEVITYIVNAFAILSPTPLPGEMSTDINKERGQPLNLPIRLPKESFRVKSKQKQTDYPRKLSFHNLSTSTIPPTFPLTLLHTFVTLTSKFSTLYATKSAYPALIAPLIYGLQHMSATSLPLNLQTFIKATLDSLHTTHTTSLTSRRPLLLHTHLPLPIKTSLPLFDASYNPSRHNNASDPDPQRRALNKLRAEHKAEKKGAMRELRKDANFLARQQLKEKRERDEEYERKMRRVVGMIQSEEGKEANDYDRMRRKRRESRR
jgi:nucleolar protein 14